MRVLLVEDDAAAARGVAFQMRSAHMVVDVSDNGHEALELVKLYDYDVIVLDIMLPDIDGFDVLSSIRAAKIQAPVLMLSSLSRTAAKVRGLDLGADDYLPKPFDASELIARITALVRRSRGLAQSTVAVQGLVVDLNSKEAEYQGTRINLTLKEYMILELLLLRKGTVLTKENFLDHLYGGIDEPDAKIIDVFMCKIRKKLAQAGLRDLIGTVWGRGYIVREAAGGRALEPAAVAPRAAMAHASAGMN